MSTFSAITISDGSHVPGIAYGAGTAWYENDTRPLVDAVKTAMECGYTHIDAAEAYCNSTSIGIAIKESGISREKLYITTKIATGLKGGACRANFLSELAKLQTSYVDLLLIHWPFELSTPEKPTEFPTHSEAWASLEALKDEGLVKSIGVSNYRIKDLQATMLTAKHPIAVNQIELHPYVLEASRPLLAFCKQHNITIEAYAPTAPLNKFPGGPVDSVLDTIAASLSLRAGHPIVPSQVLLRFAVQLGAIVVTTSGKDWRMKEQLASGNLAGGVPELTEDEVKMIVDKGREKYARVYMPHMEDV